MITIKGGRTKALILRVKKVRTWPLRPTLTVKSGRKLPDISNTSIKSIGIYGIEYLDSIREKKKILRMGKRTKVLE